MGAAGRHLAQKGHHAGDIVEHAGKAFPQGAKKVAHKADDALNKAPYHPKKMEDRLIGEYGADKVVAHNLPGLNQKNVKLAEGKHHKEFLINGEQKHIVFDKRGFPIFDDYMACEMRIPANLAKMQNAGELQMRAATRQLREAIIEGKISSDKFSPKQLQAINSGLEKIPGFTWHHHQEFARMQLVPEKIHKAIGHIGGDHMWHKKVK